VVSPTFNDLIASLPDLPQTDKSAAAFDWALHPGGSTIMSGVEKAVNITPEHMRASYDTYINHGNSSSATIISVLDRLRHKDMDEMTPGGRGPQEHVVACAFGPGIAIEMAMLKRNLRHVKRTAAGIVTPPDSEGDSPGSRSEEESEESSLSQVLHGVDLD
jgi:type III polyketide synthase